MTQSPLVTCATAACPCTGAFQQLHSCTVHAPSVCTFCNTFCMFCTLCPFTPITPIPCKPVPCSIYIYRLSKEPYIDVPLTTIVFLETMTAAQRLSCHGKNRHHTRSTHCKTLLQSPHILVLARSTHCRTLLQSPIFLCWKGPHTAALTACGAGGGGFTSGEAHCGHLHLHWWPDINLALNHLFAGGGMSSPVVRSLTSATCTGGKNCRLLQLLHLTGPYWPLNI
jgi:hypothetical protein